MKDYVISFENNNLSYFYYANNKIFMSMFKDGLWSRAQLIAEGVLKSFSLCVSPENKFHIFYQDLEANVILLTEDENNWSKRVVLYNNDPNEKIFLNFNGTFINEDFYIFYSEKIDNTMYNLLSQKLLPDDKWSQPKVIDKIFLVSDKLYNIYLTNGKSMLFYSFVNEAVTHGYTLLDKDGFKKYTPIVTTKQKITDISILEYNDKTHIVYCVKGLFSSQIIYKVKELDGTYKSKVIYEGQRISNVMVFNIKNTLYISYSVNDNIFYTLSTDEGINFTQIKKHKKSYNNITKANYISKKYDDYLSSEIYCIGGNKVIFIDELYSDFYSDTLPMEKIQVKQDTIDDSEIKELKSELINYKGIIESNKQTYEDYINKVNDHIKLLDERNDMQIKEIDTLKKQIAMLQNE